MSSKRCESARTALVVDGARAMQGDGVIARHLRGCPACRRYAAALGAVDEGLGRLPSRDAPDDLVERTLAAVRDAVPEPVPGRPAPGPLGFGSRRAAPAMAAVLVIFACAGLVHSLYEELAAPDGWSPAPSGSARLDDRPTEQDRGKTVGNVAAQLEGYLAEHQPDRESEDSVVARFRDADESERAALHFETQTVPLSEIVSFYRVPDESRGDHQSAAGMLRREGGSGAAKDEPAAVIENRGMAGRTETERVLRRIGELKNERVRTAGAAGKGKSDRPVPGSRSPSSPAFLPDAPVRQSRDSYSMISGDALLPGVVTSPAVQAIGPGAEGAPSRPEFSDVGPDRDRAAARRFLAGRESLEGLVFQPASGYWSNTYLPGAPKMRLLDARLRGSAPGAPLAAVRPNWQPFDAPRDAALATYLRADRRAISGPSRLRVQVGLQGARQRGGHRPAMNVAVVLDMRGPVAESVGTRIRALVNALVGARQAGDRFSLTVAGRPGGMLVPPERFRHGPVQVAMAALFTESGRTGGEALGLLDAMTLASRSVRSGDDPGATLGTSAVVLVTTGPLGHELPSLERLAHGNAIAGIPLSAVVVGDTVLPDQVERLTLIGQGHRRTLATAAEAAGLVDRVLHAASRAVARAVRLRIRLAPGVRLIRVLGAARLDVAAAGRVREAEQSIDRRLSRNLGIQADRGEDEEGIQIVIPGFYAGDAHVVLLDVVAEGPGPVADVTVRYKDLVHLRNGVLRSALHIPAGDRAPGPLERNVLKNELAHEMANAARAAGAHLARGDREAAASVLVATRSLIRGMRQEIGPWDEDPELRGDEAALSAYLELLRSPAGADVTRLADALRFLAHRRLVAWQD